MPELPFLEILAENLVARVSGRRIESIQIYQPALLQTASPAPMPESFHGEFFSLSRREGKYLILETESRRAIAIHLMRAGRIAVAAATANRRGSASPAAPRAARPPKHLSARLTFDDGSELHLVEYGTEKRARLWLLEDARDLAELRELGPDPSRGDLTRERFLAALGAESRQLKTFLADQRAISGIGNGLSDEILYQARLSPMKLTGALTGEEAAALHGAVLEVVETQIERLRKSAGDELPQKEPREHYAVHDHAGERCAKCGTTIARVSYADRDTFYCPGCQTGGKPLKDRRLSKLLK